MGNAAEPAPQRVGGAGDANADDREVHWRDVATKREQDLTEVREFVPSDDESESDVEYEEEEPGCRCVVQ
eukprot:PRCOL_00007081-RA